MKSPFNAYKERTGGASLKYGDVVRGRYLEPRSDMIRHCHLPPRPSLHLLPSAQGTTPLLSSGQYVTAVRAVARALPIPLLATGSTADMQAAAELGAKSVTVTDGRLRRTGDPNALTEFDLFMHHAPCITSHSESTILCKCSARSPYSRVQRAYAGM